MHKKNKNVICIDFDGVLAKYEGFAGLDHIGEPIPGGKEFIEKIKSKGLDYVIFTTREPKGVKKWCEKYSFPKPKLITNIKIPAPVYIDDRSLKFNGNFNDLFSDLKTFKVHWKKDKIFKKFL